MDEPAPNKSKLGFGRRIFRRLSLLIAFVLFFSLASFLWIATSSVRNLYLTGAEQRSSQYLRLLASEARLALRKNAEGTSVAQAFCSELLLEAIEVSLFDASGAPLCHTRGQTNSLPNPPEVGLVLAERKDTEVAMTRREAGSDHPRLFVALPIRDGSELLGVLRGGSSLEPMNEALRSLYRDIVLGAAFVGIVAAALGLALARRMSRPLEQIHRVSEQLVAGKSSPELPFSDSTEIGGLATTVYRMAYALNERLRTLISQQREQDTILAVLSDGVVLIDHQGMIRRINPAAESLLGSRENPLVDQPAKAVIRSASLRTLIERVLSGREVTETELELESTDKHYLVVSGTPLLDSFGRVSAGLIVLTDQTKMRRLETLRRDFAAHVSHELKTPLTAIQGFADTLHQGALEDPERAREFVQVIREQSTRLHELVENLLQLARIEHRAETDHLELDWVHLGDLLEGAAQSVISESGTEPDLEIDCPESLTARVNAPLLQQAISNLIDNAIRYAGDAASIRLRAQEQARDIVITVADTGRGIPIREADRVFERFYRVPQAREHNPQGTGLGLAIVKHVVLAHGGDIELETAENEGTSFRIRLPRY